MDIVSLVYAFTLALHSPQFVINDILELNAQTLGRKPEDQRYILLIQNGQVVQQAQVPLLSDTCKDNA